MAERPDKLIDIRAGNRGNWHAQLPHGSTFESTSGHISYAQRHFLSPEAYDSRQQDGVSCSVSGNLSLPVPINFHHPVGLPQNPRTDSYELSSTDSVLVGFGSDLEPMKLEARYDLANNKYTEAFNHQPALGQVQPSAFDMRSQITDHSAETESSFFGPNTADFESCFRFDAPTTTAYDNFLTASSRSVADSSPQAFVQTPPYTGSSRSRSRSDEFPAVSTTQQQSHLINSTISILATASHSSQPSGSPELTSSMAKTDIDSSSQSLSTIFSDVDFDPSSFDFAMAFAEASYSAQILEDTPSPALQANLHPVSQPNSSPSDHRFPPDLFAPLNITPLTPPTSENIRHQSPRSPTDLYTPACIRNNGIEREGWCGICRPGRWLVLKNSAFWYDKSFKHGISAASGTRFQGPVEVKRTTGKVDGERDGNGAEQGDGWEGLCGTCGVWITLSGGKRGGVPWFRHAYKCHTHPKVQDMPKRRRESKGERGSKMTISRRAGIGGEDDCPDGNDTKFHDAPESS